MSVNSPRRRTLRRFTWITGVVSLLAGGTVYLQVSGAASALASVAGQLATPDPGLGAVDAGTGGQAGQPGGQTVQQPQYGSPGYQQPPIAVTGGS